MGPDIVNHLGLADIITHCAAIGLDASGGIHVTEATGKESDELAVGLIHAGTNLGHRPAPFGREYFDHGARLALAI